MTPAEIDALIAAGLPVRDLGELDAILATRPEAKPLTTDEQKMLKRALFRSARAKKP